MIDNRYCTMYSMQSIVKCFSFVKINFIWLDMFEFVIIRNGLWPGK